MARIRIDSPVITPILILARNNKNLEQQTVNTTVEAGHYLGCWHTDQFNAVANIMDQGGNLDFSILGLGPDGIFGTDDDTNVQFVRDEFNPNEGFTGIEDNQSAIAFGATEGLNK